MEELDKILQFCKDAYSQRPCKADKSKCTGNKKCESKSCSDCDGCLQDIHYWLNTDLSYTCEYQTYFYVMKFFYRYASEIAYPIALHMQNIFSNDCLKVVSIGCGPSSELYGIKACKMKFNPEIKILYHGFDHNPIWMDLQRENISGCPDDSIEYHDNENAFDFIKADGNVNILILNYMLSDLARHNQQGNIDDFMSQLESIIKEKTVDYILINDIYLTKDSGTAYSLIKVLNDFCSKNGIPNGNIIRYQYTDPNAYQRKFGTKLNGGKVIFKQNVDLSQISPWLALKSIVEIIKVN